MAFVFTADCHMDERGFRADIGAEDGFIGLRYVAQHCLDNGLDLVIGGDLYDKNRPRPRIVNETVRILQPIIDAGHQVAFTQGNHDKHLGEAWLDGMPGALRLGRQPQQVGGHALIGIDHCSALDFTAELQACDATGADGLVCHQALVQGLGFDGAGNADLNDPAFAGFKNVWIGDLHTQKEHFSNDGSVRGVYPGPVWARNVSEAGNAGFFVVSDEKDEKGFYRYTRVDLPERPVLRLHIDSEDDLRATVESEEFRQSLSADTYAHLPEGLRRPVLYVTYFKDTMAVESTLREALEAAGGGVYVEQASPARASFTAQTMRRITDDDTEPEKFTSILARAAGGRENVRDFAIDLAQANTAEDIRSVVERWRTTHYVA